jgi:hypothetical protein
MPARVVSDVIMAIQVASLAVMPWRDPGRPHSGQASASRQHPSVPTLGFLNAMPIHQAFMPLTARLRKKSVRSQPR